MATARKDASGIKREWAAEDKQRADYIEVVLGPNNVPSVNRGHLDGAQIQQWIKSARTFPGSTGGLRMLICDRHRYDPEFPTTKETFDTAVSEFALSKRTWLSFDCDAGTFSRSYCFNPNSQVTAINLILKASQKREVGNWCISMHYDFRTDVTTALLFGTDVISCLGTVPGPEPTIETSNHPNLDFPNDLKGQEDSIEGQKWIFGNIHHVNHFQQAWPGLFKSIKDHANRMNHPLTLPCILLEDHIDRAQQNCENGLVADKTWEIMNSLGTRGDGHGGESLFWINAMSVENAYTKDARDNRFNGQKLTADMDRQVLRILYSQRSPEWNWACSKFLHDLSDEINKKVTAHAPASPAQSHPASWALSKSRGEDRFKGPHHEALKEGLEYNIEMAKALLSRLAIQRDNMNLQLDVCASITGQSSNEFNARIAWDTSRDSTSMKILAVITAAFLPGTFVATFMSMGIWNWRWTPDDPQNGQHGVVSSRWWIYLAAALPLTLLTLLGWVSWWIFELVAREKNYLTASSGGLGGTWLEKKVRAHLDMRRLDKQNKENRRDEKRRANEKKAQSKLPGVATSGTGHFSNRLSGLRRSSVQSPLARPRIPSNGYGVHVPNGTA